MYKVKEPINESFAVKKRFEWMLDDEVKAIPKGPNKITVGGRVLKSDIISKNNRHYAEEAIIKATNTLIGKPINVNHTKKIIGNVERADFNNGALEFYGTINNETYAHRIKANDPNFKGWSVQADYFFNECGKCHKKFQDLDEFVKHMKTVEFVQNFNWEPRGIVFNGLALVETPEVPGYDDTTLELLETTMGAMQLLETVVHSQEERETMSYKVKEKKEEPAKPTIKEQEEHKCDMGMHWDDKEMKCLPDMMKEHRTIESKPLPKPLTKLPFSFESAPKLSLGEPFANYTNFEDCVSKNKDKSNPEAYCGTIKQQAEGETYFRKTTVETLNQLIENLESLQGEIAAQANILPSWLKEQFNPTVTDLKQSLSKLEKNLTESIAGIPKDDLSWKEHLEKHPQDDMSWKEPLAKVQTEVTESKKATDEKFNTLTKSFDERDSKLTEAILTHKKEDEIKLKEKDDKISELKTKIEESNKKLAETTTLAENTSHKVKGQFKGNQPNITQPEPVKNKLPYKTE